MGKDKEHKKESVEIAKRDDGTTVETITPFGFMRRFTEDMERLFEDFQTFRFPMMFGRDFRKEFTDVDWVPKVEVVKQNGDFTVRAELPGLEKKDIKVEVTENVLTISGERKEEKEEKHDQYYRSERSYGSFYRLVPLPDGVNIEKATATFTNGLLEIKLEVPKTETRTRKLEIEEKQETAKAKAATV